MLKIGEVSSLPLLASETWPGTVKYMKFIEMSLPSLKVRNFMEYLVCILSHFTMCTRILCTNHSYIRAWIFFGIFLFYFGIFFCFSVCLAFPCVFHWFSFIFLTCPLFFIVFPLVLLNFPNFPLFSIGFPWFSLFFHCFACISSLFHRFASFRYVFIGLIAFSSFLCAFLL